MIARRILVASDGSPESMGALRVTRTLADASPTGIEVDLVVAVEPLPVFDTGFMVALPESELVAARGETMRERIAEVLGEVGGSSGEWNVHVETGQAAPTIARVAARTGADLLITGLGHHRAVDRIFGTETVLQLLHLVHVPVLAVPPEATEVRGSPVFALDFSTFGYRAARAATLVVPPDAEVHLAHVLSGAEHVPESGGPWRERYESVVRERLSAYAVELGLDADRTRVHLREGNPAEELLTLVEELDAGMLVAGSHGHSFIGRLLLGSVSTRLVRGATRPLLVVPPPAPPPGSAAGDAVAGPARPGWQAELDGFSRRNAGRLVDVDVHAPAWGLQHTGRGVPLRGVDFDPRADRVELMVGEPDGSRCHFTHVVPEPVHVEVVSDEEGHDRRLLVEGRESRMSVTFPSPAPTE